MESGLNSIGNSSMSISDRSQAVLPLKNSDRIISEAANSTPTYSEIPSFNTLKQTELTGGQIAISDQQVLKAIERAIKAVEGATTSLQFSIHERTKHISVKVLNKETGELIREIPPEKNLDFLANLWEKAGILVDERR